MKCKVSSRMSESPEAYASIEIAVVSISECFTLSLTKKLQKHIHLVFINNQKFKQSPRKSLIC